MRLWHRSVTTVTVCCSACRCFSPSRHLIPKQLHKSHKKTAEKNFCGFMVEVTGLEPTTSWSLTKRATKLRYTSMSLAKQHILL